jgi:hypothetical protein
MSCANLMPGGQYLLLSRDGGGHWVTAGYSPPSAARGAAISVVLASALGAGVVGTAAEWFVLVGQARAATAGSFAALGIAGQLAARLPLLVGALVLAEVIAWSTTTLAMRARRVGEASFFEITLGAPKSYTKVPALVEGLGQGLLGGLVAAAVAFVLAPPITRVERSTVGLVGSYTTVQKVGRVWRTTTHTVNLQGIQLTAGTWPSSLSSSLASERPSGS